MVKPHRVGTPTEPLSIHHLNMIRRVHVSGGRLHGRVEEAALVWIVMWDAPGFLGRDVCLDPLPSQLLLQVAGPDHICSVFVTAALSAMSAIYR